MDTKVVKRSGYSSTHPEAGDRVWVHYTGAYVVDDSPECAFSSCPLGEDPFSIVLGQGTLRAALQGFSFAEEQTIVGLEAVLKSMLEGEVAVVRIPPDQGFGAGGNPHGFHGRGQPVPPNATLIFELQLVYFEATAAIELALSKGMAEKFTCACEKKAAGNEAFKNGFIPKALVMYTQGVALVEGATEKVHTELLAQLCANLAACKAKASKWKEVITFCNKALAIDNNNSKCLFRRGKAHLSTGKYDDALKDLRRAAELEPNDKEVQAELQRLDSLLSRFQQKERAFAQNLMQGIRSTEGPLVHERPPDPEEQFTKCNVCGIKVEKVQLARHVIKAHSDVPK